MKTYLRLFIFLISCQAANAQIEAEHRPSIYLEMGGAAGFYSINLDHIVFNRDAIKFSAHIGYSYFDGSLIPFGFSLLKGKESNYFELGGNYTQYFVSSKSSNHEATNLYSFHIGYRYQSIDGGLFLKLTPMYIQGGSLGNSQPFYKKFWFGLGVGFTLLPKK